MVTFPIFQTVGSSAASESGPFSGSRGDPSIAASLSVALLLPPDPYSLSSVSVASSDDAGLSESPDSLSSELESPLSELDSSARNRKYPWSRWPSFLSSHAWKLGGKHGVGGVGSRGTPAGSIAGPPLQHSSLRGFSHTAAESPAGGTAVS